MKAYMTKSGVEQFKPSIQEAQEGDDDMQGWCLACGETQDGIEPDARRDECECCGKPKVYGFAELALMGLVHS